MTITKEPISGIWWSFPLLLSVYLISAWNMVILDCDETFNYLEPLHYLIYGHGMQTWEYGPQFALRPYSFLLLFAVPLKLIIKTFGIHDKVMVFKTLRAMIGVMSAYSQSHLLDSISTHLNSQVSLYALFIMATTTGMFASSTAFLPNTFSMILVTLVWSFWLRGQDSKVMVLTAVSAVLGWPYATIGAILPIVFSTKEAYQLKDGESVSVSNLGTRIQFELFIRRLILGTVFGLVYIACPSLIIEKYYYGRWAFPSLNAIIYNIVGGSGGPDLYGTEPWPYYCLNLVLNFSVFFAVAVIAPVAAITCTFKKKALLLWLNFAIPFTIFTLQAHKEERFLYTFYPLVCISAAISLNFVARLHKAFRPIVCMSLMGGAVLGLLRTVALIKFYSGSQYVLEEWNRVPIRAPSTICMSSSWYRFPGSFYLRDSDRLGFMQGASDGQLPMYFTSTTTPVIMNDMNKAIDAQFTDKSQCDFFMGLESEFGNGLEPVACSRIANAGLTRAPFKWLWIPYISETRTHWDPYCIYKNDDR